MSTLVDGHLTIANKGGMTMQQVLELEEMSREDGTASALLIENQATAVVPEINQALQGSIVQSPELIRIGSKTLTVEQFEQIAQALRESENRLGSFLDIMA